MPIRPHSTLVRSAARAGLLCGVIVVGLVCLPWRLDAKGRDSDASRMQARKVDHPSSHADKLDPPNDRVDWRYFKLREAKEVSISATFDDADAEGKLSLTGATGREIASASAKGANAKLSQKLDPGVYYVSVSASTATSYKLSVR